MTAAPGPDGPADAVAIVLGGSCPAGRRLARALTAGGCAVVLVYLDDQPAAEAAVEAALAAGGTAVAVRADVTDDLDVERVFAEAEAAFGRVDVVIGATGAAGPVVGRHAARAAARAGTSIRVCGPGEVAGLLACLADRGGAPDDGIPTAPVD